MVRPADKPITTTGGVVGLKGNLAPEGAIVKVAGMAADRRASRGPARCFDGEEACFEAVRNRTYKEGEVLVIRYEGPQGRPRHARDAVDDRGALRPGHGRQGRADHRRALLRRDPRLLHRPCRAGGRGRRADRAPARRRHHRHRRRRGHARGRALGRRARRAPQGLAGRARTASARAISGNTRRPSAPPREGP